MSTPRTQHPHPAPRLTGALLVVCALALLVGAIVLGWLAWQFERLDPLTQEWLRRAIFILPLGFASALAWRWFGLSSSVANWFDVLLTMARHRQGARAQHLHLEINEESTHAAPAIEGQVVDVPALAPPIPSFSELLNSGKLGLGRPLLLGFNAETHEPLEGSWHDLYSAGVGALQGAGKSWLVAFLAAQSAITGDRLIICDPNPHTPESLSTRIEALSRAFICDIATTPDEILSALKMANDRLEQRKAGKGGSWGILVVIDEWTSLLRTKVGAALPAYLENFTEQGRKYHVNALLSAQGWTKDTSGGAVRNRLTAHYVLRQRPDEARYQLGLRAGQLPDDIRNLPDATGYLLDVRGNLTKIVIPHMTTADLARAGTLIPERVSATGQPFGLQPAARVLTPSASAGSAYKREISTLEALLEAPAVPAQSSKPLSAEAARVVAAFRAGKDVTEIAKDMNGGKTNGPPYIEKLRQVNALLREMTGGEL